MNNELADWGADRAKKYAAHKLRIPKLYKPEELRQAIGALQCNGFHSFHESEARAIVMALHQLGYRIIYVGEVDGGIAEKKS